MAVDAPITVDVQSAVWIVAKMLELRLERPRRELIDRLVVAFEEADAAARAGDLVGREEKLAEAVQIATELQALRDQIDGGGRTQGDGVGEPSGAAPPEDPATTTTTTAGA